MLGNQQNRQQAATGLRVVYVSPNLDLAEVLRGNEGTYEAIFSNQAFAVICEGGHSIKSLIPTGTRPLWIITELPPAETAQYVESETRRRGVGVGA